jgi:hypothetical protein
MSDFLRYHMKIKEAIQILQRMDQDLDITDGSAALYYIDVLPAYYDGCYTRLKQDESIADQYNIVGAKIISEGYKCVLHFMGAKTLCWEDGAIENSNFFEYDDNSKMKEKRFIDAEIRHSRACNEEIRAKFLKDAKDIASRSKIIQTAENSTGDYSFWEDAGDDGLVRLGFGVEREIVESGLFERIENDTYYEWRLI